MNPKVDAYLDRIETWQKEVAALRVICLQTHLDEDLKWGQPCYTLHGKNIVLIGGGFNKYCVLLLFKGALMPDEQKLLVTPGEHQAARQLRFTSVTQIKKLKPTILQYIRNAIAVEQSGAKIQKKVHEDYPVAEELTSALKASPKFQKAWEALTPGRQRGYMLHFAAAKQSATRATRIKKATPNILEGKGLLE